MKRNLIIAAGLGVLAIAVACHPHGPRGHAHSRGQAQAATQLGGGGSGEVQITRQGDEICVRSNGLPNHATGRFPNSGNPHTMRAQRTSVCVDATPSKGATARELRGTIGVAVNGVLIRPGTADYYDPGSRRGFSRDRSSGWNLEGMGSAQLLGLDQNNAHVDQRGLYHYHGEPSGLLAKLDGSQMGWAADGFEIHIAPAGVTSSWQLKPGTRPSAPGGRYDGQYVQDWQYVAGSGSLDECNGGMLNGQYVYFATKTFPFYPRCVWGTPSRDFGRP
ncbi:MAG: YHYH protein [Pseudomonadota bacterium]